MFSKIMIIGIFVGVALIITGIISMVSSWAKQDMCQHTPITELQKSGDYYSCLQGVK